VKLTAAPFLRRILKLKSHLLCLCTCCYCAYTNRKPLWHNSSFAIGILSQN
jgi:hypothetical protein